MKPMSEILEAVGASKYDIENWLRSVHLSTEYMQVARGATRLFSRENTIELAFFAALVRCGITVGSAASYVEQIVASATNNRKRKWIGRFQDWIVFPAGEHPVKMHDGKAVIAFEPTVTQAIIVETARLSATMGVNVINSGGILDRIDALFNDEQQEAD